jgi:two-component system, sporulation sensor kinase D
MSLIDYNAGLIDGLEGVLSALIHNGTNHLGPIKGYASLIQDDTDDASNARRWADKIMRNVREMEDHFHALDMFRLRGAIGVCEISWPRLVSDVMDRFAAANLRGVPIEIINEAQGTFRQHRELLKRVLLHLVVNAYESIERNGQIVISVKDHAPAADGRRRYAVCVNDTGRGMDGEVMKRSWTPFFTTKQNHIGLGLPYVAAAASVMEMEIEVASTLGQGTDVGLVLVEQGG